MSECCKNTDREIWRSTPGDYYSPSVHVTESGCIRIACKGSVTVAKPEVWQKFFNAALAVSVAVREREREWKSEIDKESTPERKAYAEGAWRACCAIADDFRNHMADQEVKQ